MQDDHTKQQDIESLLAFLEKLYAANATGREYHIEVLDRLCKEWRPRQLLPPVECIILGGRYRIVFEPEIEPGMCWCQKSNGDVWGCEVRVGSAGLFVVGRPAVEGWIPFDSFSSACKWTPIPEPE